MRSQHQNQPVGVSTVFVITGRWFKPKSNLPDIHCEVKFDHFITFFNKKAYDSVSVEDEIASVFEPHESPKTLATRYQLHGIPVRGLVPYDRVKCFELSSLGQGKHIGRQRGRRRLRREVRKGRHGQDGRLLLSRLSSDAQADAGGEAKTFYR
jgi:hypothetical protein